LKKNTCYLCEASEGICYDKAQAWY